MKPPIKLKWPERMLKDHLFGVHLAVNIFIATTILWLILRRGYGITPIWAISSMIAATDPNVATAYKTFHGRLMNTLLGCCTGFFFLMIGGENAWKLPVCLSFTILLSSYVVHIPTMWRQAPITAAIVIASGLTAHETKIGSMELGAKRVGEVILGCLVGLGTTYLISKVWPMPKVEEEKV